jgi:hypothetical protein
MKRKSKFCQTAQANPICATEGCNCGKPILLAMNLYKEVMKASYRRYKRFQKMIPKGRDKYSKAELIAAWNQSA